MTFREYAEHHWLPNLRRRQAKPSTLASYQSMLERHVYPEHASTELLAFTPERIETLLTAMEHCSPKYQRNVCLLLKAVFNYAVESCYLERSPIRAHHLPRLCRAEKPAWTESELSRILKAIPVERRAIFQVAALTGMRIGELLGLTWRQVDFDARRIVVNRALWRGQAVTPKSSASVRSVPMGIELYRILHDEQMRQSYSAEAFVFHDPQGKPYNADTLRRSVLYPVLDRLGILHGKRDSGFHRFRHSAGSIIVSRTGNLKLAQRLLGHSSIQTTADIYAHVRDDELREAAAVLERSA